MQPLNGDDYVIATRLLALNNVATRKLGEDQFPVGACCVCSSTRDVKPLQHPAGGAVLVCRKCMWSILEPKPKARKSSWVYAVIDAVRAAYPNGFAEA